MIELKPCPFCGGEARIANDIDEHHHDLFLFVYCTSCGIRTPIQYYVPFTGESRNGAISRAVRLWNRRADNRENRVGQWQTDEDGFYLHCSECGKLGDLVGNWNYCPNCGAHMRGGRQ